MGYLIMGTILVQFLFIGTGFARCTPEQVTKMINAGFTKKEINAICNPVPSKANKPLMLKATMMDSIGQMVGDVDFTRGSRVAYRGQFNAWPKQKNQYGVAQPEAKGYGLQAVSNTWVGPGQYVDITPDIHGDFILDLTFKVVHRTNASMSITLSDAGKNYPQVEFFFDIWEKGNLTYSIYENYVKNNFYSNIRRKFAERLPVKWNTSTIDWGTPNTLTIKREGNRMAFYLNRVQLHGFSVPTFPLKKMGLGLAFKSKILFTSVQARVPK